jgi:class 3 adenylate cyclase
MDIRKKNSLYIVYSSPIKVVTNSIIFFLLSSLSLFCQNQKLADSLELRYTQGDFKEENKLILLKELAHNHPNLEQKLFYSNELLSVATAMDSSQYFFTAYLEKGNALVDKGDMSLAIENYLKAGDVALDENSNTDLATIYASVGGVYIDLENTKAGISYYRKAVEILNDPKILKDENDTVKLATTFENLGYTYLTIDKPDSALIYLNESGALFERINWEIGVAYNMANKGLAYAQLKDYTKAENSINDAFKTLEKDGHFTGMCQLLMEISEIYLIRNDISQASEFAFRGLDLAKIHNLKPEISDANLQLSKIYQKIENENQSLAFFKNHIIYRDSVKNLASIQEISNMRTNFEVSQKQTEVDLLNEQKANQKILIFSLIAILAITGFYYSTVTKAKRRSDELLLNILPSGTAEELKQSGKVDAKKFDSITVMFTDFQGFTKYSQNLSPEVLVRTVDYYFSKFDEIIDKYGLEKIKTIGDAYMCAGGLPYETKDHPEKILNAAFEISKFMRDSKESNLGDLAHFNIRIGINTGPVVAGVVGRKKFAYDIWGDTVNVAARMESNSKEGKINISHNTYVLIKDSYECEYRGEIDVKNKGMMKMYFVNNQKKNVSYSNEAQKVLY